MKLVHALLLALALAAVGASAWAAQHDQHQGHHPAGATSAPASNSMSGKSCPDLAAWIPR